MRMDVAGGFGVELLGPAKDAEVAIAAVECGADAVYMGAQRFGAREAAGNSVDEIARATEYAHRYYAKVYAAVNTLVYDDELEAARELVGQLAAAGVDGLIIADMGLVEVAAEVAPGLALIASTQANNATVEKVKFLEGVGFSRVILARELGLDRIREIGAGTDVELECFVHGAICVGVSGQCYMSYAAGGRSGNRGRCAQPCRKKYRLSDGAGKVLSAGKHLLSVRDMNRAEYLEELIDAGVRSFKIEGRLKDVTYVANVVGYYRKRLDEIIERRGLRPSSSGKVELGFEPDPVKSFCRGFTDYGLVSKGEKMGSIETPKSMGEYVGKVVRADKVSVVVGGDAELHPGDGICFFDEYGELTGTVVNKVEGRRVWPFKAEGMSVGQEIWRNYDHKFAKLIEKRLWRRTVGVKLVLKESADGLTLEGTDEDGNVAAVEIAGERQVAKKPEQARETIVKQLGKFGGTMFACDGVDIATEDVYFLAVSQLNEARRELVERLMAVRADKRPVAKAGQEKKDVTYPEKKLTYLGNVVNEKARAFYERHGVEEIESGADLGLDMQGKLVMTTKHCVLRELGMCLAGSAGVQEPFELESEDGRRYEVRCRCGDCGMDIYLK